MAAAKPARKLRRRGLARPPEDESLGAVMLLAKNILEQLTVRGVLPLEDLRERLCVASESRMKAALDELRRQRLIQVGEGRDLLVNLVGERRPYYPRERS
ncbi:MAG TPA: hypothetical protein VFA75_10080 [Nevskia sp.]|nr:hypothetical protein [Nevskia sp.]